MTKKSIKKDDSISVLDALNDVASNLVGISEITLALSGIGATQESLAIISNITYNDAMTLQKVAAMLEYKK